MLALSGGTIYADPESDTIDDGVVLIDDGHILAVGPRAQLSVPETAEILDCCGCIVTAGFWNSHVHFLERKWMDAGGIPKDELAQQLQGFTQFGFTSVFDLSSPIENTHRIRERVESGDVDGPRIFTTGLGLIRSGGNPPDIVTGMMGWMKAPLIQVEDAMQASNASRELLDAGADGIKVFASSPFAGALSEDAVRAAVAEAHTFGKPSFVHPDSADDVATALRAGVDVIAHTTPRSVWDLQLLELIEGSDAALIPTLWLWKWYARHDRVSAQQRVIEAMTEQVRLWIDAGRPILFGTDDGAVDHDPTEEYILMSQSGMNFRAILTSLTTAPAAKFGESHHLGRIAKGFTADIVVLSADPSTDIRATATVKYTLRNGQIIYRAEPK